MLFLVCRVPKDLQAQRDFSVQEENQWVFLDDNKKFESFFFFFDAPSVFSHHLLIFHSRGNQENLDRLEKQAFLELQ